VDSGSGREKVGTGKGSGQFTPEVAIEHPEALRELHREFLRAGSQVLQALTFFGTREKLTRAGYGAQTETINAAAAQLLPSRLAPWFVLAMLRITARCNSATKRPLSSH